MYIGNTPAENYASFLTETFTVSATTNYTLSHAVTNENDIRLVINGVVQQPGSGKAYTASGTTLTLTSATVSGDVMYAVYLGRALQTVNPPNASVGTAQLGSEAVTNAKVASTVITGQTAETSIATDDLILLSDTSASGALRKMTKANFVSGIGGTNTPNFEVRKSSGNQSINNTTWTKVNFQSETFDSDSAMDLGNDKFTVPSGKGGKYFLYTAMEWAPDDRGVRKIAYYKNGSLEKVVLDQDGHDQGAQQASVGAILSLSATDYIELYVYQTTGDAETIYANGEATYFGGYKLIE